MKSLRTNWIRQRCDKSLPTPNVIYKPLEHASGEYFHDTNTIIISTFYIDYEESILLHEFRHHWQLHNGWVYDGIGLGIFGVMEYNTALRSYYSKSKSEMDALRFDYKYSSRFDPYSYEVLYDILL